MPWTTFDRLALFYRVQVAFYVPRLSDQGECLNIFLLIKFQMNPVVPDGESDLKVNHQRQGVNDIHLSL